MQTYVFFLKNKSAGDKVSVKLRLFCNSLIGAFIAIAVFKVAQKLFDREFDEKHKTGRK